MAELDIETCAAGMPWSGDGRFDEFTRARDRPPVERRLALTRGPSTVSLSSPRTGGDVRAAALR